MSCVKITTSWHLAEYMKPNDKSATSQFKRLVTFNARAVLAFLSHDRIVALFRKKLSSQYAIFKCLSSNERIFGLDIL